MADKQSRADRRLLRSSSDRMLWGVAGGLGDYFRMDPTLVRLAFAAATIFGGFGVIAYLVMAVVVPEDDGSGKPREGRRPTWAIVLLALAVLIALPGPFWGFGWHHGGWPWWGFFGPIWFLFLVGVAFLIARALRRGSLFRDRRRDAGGSGDTATTEMAAGDEGPPRALRIILMIVAACAALSCAVFIATLAAWATATGHGTVVAGVVIAIGVAIAATAFIADTARIAPWLLTGALVLGLPAGAIAAADIHFNGGIGERRYEPSSISDLPPGGYDFGVGQMIIDLRSLPWQNGQAIPVKTNLGIGQMIVSVPSNVCVHAHATGKAGELLIRGDQSDGVDPEVDQGEPRSQAPRLDLDAEIQLGQMIVTDQDPDDVADHGFDYDHNRLTRDEARRVCGL